jgi:hypothetical protein
MRYGSSSWLYRKITSFHSDAGTRASIFGMLSDRYVEELAIVCEPSIACDTTAASS